MVAYENNKYYGMMYIFVSQALFLRPSYWPVWKCAYMLWKWQHLAILQRCLDLNLLGKYFYAAYLYSRVSKVVAHHEKLLEINPANNREPAGSPKRNLKRPGGPGLSCAGPPPRSGRKAQHSQQKNPWKTGGCPPTCPLHRARMWLMPPLPGDGLWIEKLHNQLSSQKQSSYNKNHQTQNCPAVQ